MECGFDTHKNSLIKNLVILFAFFCAVEPIYSFFKPIFFIFIYNTAHRPSTHVSYTVSRVRPKKKISCAPAANCKRSSNSGFQLLKTSRGDPCRFPQTGLPRLYPTWESVQINVQLSAVRTLVVCLETKSYHIFGSYSRYPGIHKPIHNAIRSYLVRST